MVSLRAVCASLDRRTILWWSLALLVPVLLFDPVRQTFLLGQINILLAVLVAADMTLDLPIPRGILVGLAAAIKVTPIILIPYLFMTRQSRSGFRAIGTFCAGRPRRHRGVAGELVELLDALHPGPATGRHALVDRQPGIARGDRAGPRSHRHHADDLPHRGDARPRVGLLVAAGAYRRSSPVLGFLVVEATESLANPVSWSHHFIWVVLLVAWLALAEDRPRYGEWYALGASRCCSGRRPTGGSPTAPTSPSPGGAGSSRSRTPTSFSSWC